jgi:hypothetical protein
VTTSDWIAAVSLLISTGLGVWSYLRERDHAHTERAAKDAADQLSAQYLEVKTLYLKIQEQLLEIERERDRNRTASLKKAELRGSLERLSSHTHRFVVANRGPADAKNIRVFIDGTPVDQHDSVMNRDGIPSTIAKRDKASCQMCFTLQTAPPFNLRIEWEDDSGEPGVLESILNY